MRNQLCTRVDLLPERAFSEVYKIFASIAEYGKERFRDKLIALLEPYVEDFSRNVSCQYLVAKILLHCPEKIKILDAQKTSINRRRFFKFSTSDALPKTHTFEEFEQLILSSAIKLTDNRTSLGESVTIVNTGAADDACWQFIIEGCNQVKETNFYNQSKKENTISKLPLIGRAIVRFERATSELEINIASQAEARAFVKILNHMIWSDNRQHFREQAIFDLSPLRDIGKEVLLVQHPSVKKVVINMLEVHFFGKNYPIIYGKNSKTIDVTNVIGDIKGCLSIDQAYFTAISTAGDSIKFGIKLPDKLDCLSVNRPLATLLAEQMGFLKQ